MTIPRLGWIDRASAYAIANRVFAAPAGLVTAGLVAVLFSPELQGYYFTFVGLLTLQSLVELGLPGVLQQFASHEWARRDDPSPEVRGRARARLAHLLRLGVLWYGGVALLVGVGLGAAGSLYLGTFARSGAGASHLAVWWFAAIATGAAALPTPLFAILEGTNRVERVYGARLVQGVASRAAGWLAILAGLGLWAIPLSRAVTLVAGALAMLGAPLRRLREIGRGRVGSRETMLSWAAEIRPLQGRYAMSWLSGYLLSSLFTPVLFALHGPVLAGRMGMTVAVGAAVSSVAFALLAPKLPQLAIFAARGETAEKDALFRRAAAACLGAGAAGATLVVLGSLVLVELDVLDGALAARLLPPAEVAVFLTAGMLQQIRFVLGSYLRAHKEEPYALLAALEAGLALALLPPLAGAFGSAGMVTGYFTLSAAFLLPAAIVFRRRRRDWRARDGVAGLRTAEAES